MEERAASYMQEGWFRARGDHLTNHNIALAWALEGPVDVGALREAVRQLVDRHDALRTVLAEQDGQVRQVVSAPGGPVALWEEDLSEVGDPERALSERIVRDVDRAFDLTAGPLWRGGVARLPSGGAALGLTVSHAVADGWSAAVAERDLRRLYRALVGGGRARLAPVEVQFGEYAEWERGLRDPEAEAWWREYLREAPRRGDLRMERGGVGREAFEMVTVRRAVPPAVVDGLRRSLPAGDTTLAAVVTAAAVCASLAVDEDQAVVGVLHANRRRYELQGTLGPVFDYVPIRVDAAGGPRFADLAAEVRGELGRTRQHGVPLGLVERAVGVADVGGGVFSLAVDFMPRRAGGRGQTAGVGRCAFTDVPVDDSRVVHRGELPFAVTAPITYVVREEPEGGFGVELYGDACAVGTDGIHALGDQFVETLVAVAEKPLLRCRGRA